LGGFDRSASGIVVLGGADDVVLAESVIAELGTGRNLCGRLSLRQSARVLAAATHYYGIDSMLLHIARALGVPTTSVWGPSKPTTLLRPMTNQDTVFYAGMACSPCIHVHETPPCRGARDCIPAALARAPITPVGESAEHVAVGWATGPDNQIVRPVAVRFE
jgi:ADP-heptose:LPS heptosyltransferase